MKDEAGGLESWQVLGLCLGSLNGVWRFPPEGIVGSSNLSEVRGDFNIFLCATLGSLEFGFLAMNDSRTN